MKGVSLIICCYNSAYRLPATLKHIAEQSVNSNINWELIIVNNASDDNTTQVALSSWSEHKLEIDFQVVDEPAPGLSFARQKGIQVSKYDYLVFCDDDNWLDKDYINIAFQTMEAWPDAGIAGGQQRGYFEIPKPYWFDDFSQSYAVEKPMENSGFIMSREYLAGAGMVVRRSLFNSLKNMGWEPLLTGRIGKSLMSGEDYELCLVAGFLGYKIYYNENLKLTHFITKERLTWEYCINMTTSGQALPEIFYDLYKAANHAYSAGNHLTFNRIYIRLIRAYLEEMIFLGRGKYKNLFKVLLNIRLFFTLKPGSFLQRKLLSEKNKLFFLLSNRKMLSYKYKGIQKVIKKIHNSL